MNLHFEVSRLILAFSTYVFVTASPGPANMAIMATSMNFGRMPGVALASGVIAGSQFWGISADIGLSSVVAHYPAALHVISTLGGIYFIWLAYKALKAALEDRKLEPAQAGEDGHSFSRYFMQGLGIHLLNPKAILGWLAVIALGVDAGSSAYATFLIVFGCFVLGVLVFGTYAFAFSTPVMIRLYTSAKRWIQLGVGVMFAIAAFGLLAPLLSRA